MEDVIPSHPLSYERLTEGSTAATSSADQSNNQQTQIVLENEKTSK